MPRSNPPQKKKIVLTMAKYIDQTLLEVFLGTIFPNVAEVTV
jgi:hypothetical protein